MLIQSSNSCSPSAKSLRADHGQHRGTFAQPSLQRSHTRHDFSLGTALLLLACLAIAGCSAASSAQHTPTAPAGPTPTATASQRITALVHSAVGSGPQSVDATYDPTTATVAVTATVGWSTDVPTAQAQVKAIIFHANQALWTSGTALQHVTVTVLGPVVDDYGSTTTNVYGTADLTAPTATKLNWATLTPDAAWNRYDSVFLRESYRPFQLWGTTPAPTPA